MKQLLFEGMDDILLYASKLILSFSFLSYYFLGGWLLNYGMQIEYLYFGMLGQSISILLQSKDRIEKTKKLSISTVGFVIGIIEFLLGGIIAMLFVSFLSSFPQLKSLPMSGIAILTGAMYEYVWKALKRRFKKFIDDDISESTTFKSNADGGENNSGSGGM